MAKEKVKRYEDCTPAEKKAMKEVIVANGGDINEEGKLISVSEAIAEFDETFNIVVDGITTGVNKKAEPILIVSVKKPIKFLSDTTGKLEDQYQIHLNGSKSNILTDIGVMNGDNVFATLDKGQTKQLLRMFKGATGSVDVSVTKQDGVYTSIAELMLDYDLARKERVMDGLSQLLPSEKSGL